MDPAKKKVWPSHCPDTGLPYWHTSGAVPKSQAGKFARRPRLDGKEEGDVLRAYHAPELIAGCRATYESTPGMTFDALARDTGIPRPTLQRWAREFEWKKMPQVMPQVNAKAAEMVNKIKMKMSELGVPMSDHVAAEEAAKAVAEQNAVEIRAAVLDRHRKEWAAPRKIAYDAMKNNDLDKAKLAKLAAETLQIVQIGESRAFGLNEANRGADGGTIVAVERTQAPQQLPSGPVLEPQPGADTVLDDGDGVEF